MPSKKELRQQQQAARRARQRAAGLCSQCTNPVKPGHERCDYHLAKRHTVTNQYLIIEPDPIEARQRAEAQKQVDAGAPVHLRSDFDGLPVCRKGVNDGYQGPDDIIVGCHITMNCPKCAVYDALNYETTDAPLYELVA